MKFYGSIDLSKIDKSLIKTGKNGHPYLDVDIYTNDAPDRFGNDGCIAIYNKETQTRTYLGNFKRSIYDPEGQKSISPTPQFTAEAPAYDASAPFAAVVEKDIAARRKAAAPVFSAKALLENEPDGDLPF